MSLLGWAVAGGIQGAGRGAAEVLKTKRMLKGEKLRHEYQLARQKSQQEFQKGLASEATASRETIAREGMKSREDIAAAGTKSREDIAGAATASRETISREAMGSRETISREAMGSREDIAGERNKLLKEEGRKNRQLRRDLSKAGLLKGVEKLKEPSELEARKYLAERFNLSGLKEQRESLGEDEQERATELDFEISEIYVKIDDIINTRNETGQFPLGIKITRENIESSMNATGKSYEETVQEYMERLFDVPLRLRTKPTHSPFLAPSH